ncbi:oligoribonuclease-like [Chenopodium quinoa]|uniref:Exonuclease domain-containing protein n=1 Tax=Chenopodium quinoa TaxID=63459 RepID=A0A803KV76_CHEQI|nr:oligoribonuclease-like [Chenopodium quinoa]XP_021754879.1 oligoribonuclease-like [Chenopodium quinoa]
MDLVANAFSVLALDDGEDPSKLLSASVSEAGESGKKSKSKSKSSDDKLVVDNGNNKEHDLGVVSDYRLPLVWIDLEMTGLNVEVDRILEIACIITDGNLSKSVEGPEFVIHQSQECLDKMNEWCQDHHAASGLTKKVLESTVTEHEAEQQVIEFVKKHVGTYTPLLAGNSVYTDFIFLKKYMPDLASMFSHVLVDVSSVKALCVRWYPKAHRKAPSKEQKHRALDDIRESILELKYYKDAIFKSRK